MALLPHLAPPEPEAEPEPPRPAAEWLGLIAAPPLVAALVGATVVALA
jgi:hypothetical protein